MASDGEGPDEGPIDYPEYTEEVRVHAAVQRTVHLSLPLASNAPLASPVWIVARRHPPGTCTCEQCGVAAQTSMPSHRGAQP